MGKMEGYVKKLETRLFDLRKQNNDFISEFEKGCSFGREDELEEVIAELKSILSEVEKNEEGGVI